MDAVKQYLFWIVIGAVVLVGLAFWYLNVPGLQAEAQVLKDGNDAKKIEVEKAAKESKDIKNKSYVKAAEDFQKYLAQEKGDIFALLKDKKLIVPEEFKNAPEKLLDFNDWMRHTREKILKTASDGGMALPKDFSTQKLYEDRPAETAVQRQDRIRELAVLEELVHILSTTKVDIPIRTFENDNAKPDGSGTAQAGVHALARLEILTSQQFAAKDKAWEKKAYELVKASDPGMKEAPKPYASSGVELVFTAPFAAVLPVLQKLESSQRFFAVVRKIDTRRLAPPYPNSETVRYAAATLGEKEAPAVNSYFREGPLEVSLLMELLEYDEAKAKALEAPPKAPEKKAPSRNR